jgi:hypothetical protein
VPVVVAAPLRLVAAASAGYPVRVPASWRAVDRPAWYRAALCVHRGEGAWDANTGNGQYGGLQFSLGTWAGVGGRLRPDQASPREQLYRAWLLWKLAGWAPWPNTARACGLR